MHADIRSHFWLPSPKRKSGPFISMWIILLGDSLNIGVEKFGQLWIFVDSKSKFEIMTSAKSLIPS